MGRFNFVIDDDTDLDEVAKETGRSSKADVVRDALAFYQYVLRRLSKGDKMFLGPDGKNVTELAVTTFEKVQRKALTGLADGRRGGRRVR